jgi:Flp pilus assembly protein TadD
MMTLVFGAFAQNANVNRADKAFKDGNLVEAKNLIDEAASNDKTRDDARMKYTRALIYQSISVDNSGEFNPAEQESARVLAVKLFEDLIASEKENSTYHILATQGKENFYGLYFNQAVEFFNEDEFEDAMTYFQLASEILPGDTTALLYGGYAAQNADRWDVAQNLYEQLVAAGSQDITVFKTMVYIHRAIDVNADKALSYIQKARAIDPSDQDLTREMVNILIEQEKMDQALTEMEKAVAAEPNNEMYHLNIGIIYDNKGDLENAMKSYNRVLELDPNNFEVNFNVGAIYYNRGAELVQEANNMDLDDYQTKGKELEKQAKEQFEKALPYLEKAFSSKQDDVQTVQTLVTVYSQLGNTAKVQSLTNLLEMLLGDDGGE